VPLNKQQNVEYMTERSKQQFLHFNQEIERIIAGHRDQEFDDGIVEFIANIGLSDMTEAEKELVFSEKLSSTRIGRMIRDMIEDFL